MADQFKFGHGYLDKRADYDNWISIYSAYTIHEMVGRCLYNTFVKNVGHKQNLLGYYCCGGENEMSLFSEQLSRENPKWWTSSIWGRTLIKQRITTT